MAFGSAPSIRFRMRELSSEQAFAPGSANSANPSSALSLSQRLQELVPDLIDAVLLIGDTENHEVLWLNKAGGQQYPEWPSQTCYQLFEGRESPCPACPIRNLTESTPYVREFLSDNDRRYMRCTTKVFRFEGRKLFLVALQNIDSAKRREQLKEQELQKQRDVNAVFSDTMALLSQTDRDFTDTVHSILDKLGNTHNANRVQVFELYTNPAGKILADCTFEWCAPGSTPHAPILQKVDSGIINPWLNFFQEGNTLYLEDVEAMSDDVDAGQRGLRELLKSLGVRSVILQAFYYGEKIAGFIAVDTPRRYRREYSLAQSLATAIAQEKSRRDQIDELTSLGTIDQLSGLQNRNRFNQVKAELVVQMPNTLGVAYIDLNNLKTINDEQGHEQGDAYIRAMSDCFVRYFRQAETYRVGGDEFIVLAVNISRELFEKRLALLLADAEKCYTKPLAIGSVWSEAPTDLDELIGQADALMYENKRKVKAEMGQEVR